mgnify:CR=1 FL=1
MSYRDTYEKWLHSSALSPEEKAELEGIANDEIARRLGISTRTVENQISRALSELRKLVTLILFFF